MSFFGGTPHINAGFPFGLPFQPTERRTQRAKKRNRHSDLGPWKGTGFFVPSTLVSLVGRLADGFPCRQVGHGQGLPGLSRREKTQRAASVGWVSLVR